MGKNITITYITCRKDPRIEWFFSSLLKQDLTNISQIIVVDFWKEDRALDIPALIEGIEINHVLPLPSAIQGKYRLTSINWFSASNARNTGAIYCKNDYVIFIDDLSVISDNFLMYAKEAAENNQCVLCAYEKMNKIEVKDGVIVSYEKLPNGKDCRLGQIRNAKTKAVGGWWYGNCGLPLEYILQLNGWDNIHDCAGAEDTAFGARLNRITKEIYYDSRMLLIESDEHHFMEDNYFKRDAFACSQEHYFKMLEKYGISEKPIRPLDKYDAVWFVIDLLKYFPNQVESFLNPYSIRALRDKVLKGQEITVADMHLPEKQWFTGLPLQMY